MSARKRTIPPWGVLAIGGVLTAGGLLWSSTLYDERGQAVLDGPTATVLVALLGVVGTLLTLLVQRSKDVQHELKPNSGSSLRDAVDRADRAAAEALAIAKRTEAKTDQTTSDLGELREDVQATRTEVQGTRADIGRLADLITQKEK